VSVFIDQPLPPGPAWAASSHHFCASCGAVSQRPLHGWIELADVEALARFDTNLLHLRRIGSSVT